MVPATARAFVDSLGQPLHFVHPIALNVFTQRALLQGPTAGTLWRLRPGIRHLGSQRQPLPPAPPASCPHMPTPSRSWLACSAASALQARLHTLAHAQHPWPDDRLRTVGGVNSMLNLINASSSGTPLCAVASAAGCRTLACSVTCPCMHHTVSQSLDLCCPSQTASAAHLAAPISCTLQSPACAGLTTRRPLARPQRPSDSAWCSPLSPP